MNQSTAARITRTSIKEILIIETGTYNQMYARPYTTDLDIPTLNAVTNSVVGTYQNTGSVNAGSLVDVAGSFIRPSADPERIVHIPQGWNEKRLRFMMAVEYEWATGGRTREYITGYTDYVGISLKGTPDDRMNFYVSSVLSTRETLMRDPVRGSYVVEVPVSSSQMLSNPNFNGVFGTDRLMGIRPQDLFLSMDNSQWADLSPGLSNITDARLEIRETGHLSSRSWQIPSKYMANVIDSYVQANAQVDFSNNDEAVKRQAHLNSKEKMIAHNPFLTAVGQTNKTYGNCSHFTLRDLRSMDPTVTDRMALAVSDPNLMQTTHRSGQTENWHGRDALTLAAASLAQSIPGLMSELLLTKVSIVSSNNWPDGQMRSNLPMARSIAKNVDMTRNYGVFLNRLEREILSGITHGNQLSYNLSVTADLVGETYITISLDGSPETPFCMPSFADNLMPVVVTNNQAVVDGVSNDFNTLLSNIGANIDTPAGGYAQPTQSHYSNAVVL